MDAGRSGDGAALARAMPADFEAFAAEARARGHAEALVREWEPGHVTPVHSHPFDTMAVVVRGAFVLVVGGEERHLVAGDRFELARGIDHAERYGPEGATFWAARRA
jgi:quercetin dioxygenase-like cupin family protein